MSSYLRPSMSSVWTPEREEEFVSMMEAKPELFDNTEINFSNKTAKMNVWLEMAEHFRLSEKELKKKWDSLRTQYSRYTKLYGAGGTDGRLCTGRQQWILQRLKFLDPHIKRRSSYCTDLDYEVTVVENSSDGLSPAQVDIELEGDHLSTSHLPKTSDSEINLELFKGQLGKRAYQDEERVSPQSLPSKRHCSDRVHVLDAPECEDEDEEDEVVALESGNFRRLISNETEDCWDVFGRYVVSCLKSLDTTRSRIKAQNELCAVLQKHMERKEEEEEKIEVKEKQKTSNAKEIRSPKAPADQDELEPFLKSMSIIMKKLPESVRAEVQFRIHELVHRAGMKHLYQKTSSQNTNTPGQEPSWENGLDYNLI